MCVESDCQLEIGDEDANSINSHACNPEANFFSVRLHGLRLVQTIEHYEEYNQSVPQSIKNPLHEESL